MDHPTGGQVGVGWQLQLPQGAWPVGSLTNAIEGSFCAKFFSQSILTQGVYQVDSASERIKLGVDLGN